MQIQQTYNVGIYCRLSRDDNAGNSESLSIANQREMLLSYAYDNGWNVVDEYIDDGFSGTNFERPSFKRMIADIEQGKINCVVAKDLSRLGRNYIMTGQYTDFFFPQYGVRFVAINDSFDSNNVDNDIAPFKNILNEMYAKDISRKVRSSRAISAKQGKFMGSRPPYGYMRSSNDKHKLIIDEEAAEVVKRMYKMFANGESARHIASIFNEAKVLCPLEYYYKKVGQENPYSRNSQTWCSATIMQLLKNEVYLGNMVQGKRKVVSFKNKQRQAIDEKNWIAVENTHEAIIQKDVWDTVQKRHIVNQRVRIPVKNKEVSLFSGVIKCADCGSALTYNKKKSGNSVTYIYKCSRYANHSKSVCTMHYTKMETLCQLLLNDIKVNASLASKDEEQLIKKIISSTNVTKEKELAQMRSKHREAKKRLMVIDNNIKKLFEEKIAGNIPDNIFKSLMSDYEKERLSLNSEIENFQKSLSEHESTTKDISAWVSRVKKYLNLDKITRDVVSELVDKIIVSEPYYINGEKRQDVTIKYKFVGCLS